MVFIIWMNNLKKNIMKNVDVEIYINQFILFFNNNPNDLIELIGDVLKDDFYKRVKQQSLENIEKGEDVSLTQSQVISIVVELKESQNEVVDMDKIKSLIYHTKFAHFSLN
jgi:hypothetical protein